MRAWNDKIKQSKNDKNSARVAESSLDSADFPPDSANHTADSANLSKLIGIIFPPHSTLSTSDFKTYRDISIFTILNIFFLICVFSPFALYSSDVTQFDASQSISTLSALFGFFLFLSGSVIYATSFFYKTRLLKIGVFAVSVVLILGVVYSLILVGDYGAMDRFILQKLNFSNPDLRLQKYVFFICTTLFSVLVAGVFLKRLASIFKILFIALVILSSLDFYKIITNTQDTKITSNIGEQPYQSELFSYSKTQKNIVIFVLDMFSGSHTPHILEQFPRFKSNLDGFMLFPNTISTTNSTIHSVATLISGEYYAVYNMNARKDNLKSTIERAFSDVGNAFGSAGFSVGMIATTGASAKNITNNHIFAIDSISNQFSGYYIASNKGLINAIAEARDSTKHTEVIQLLSFGVFRFSPELFFRPRIYNNGFWFGRGNQKIRDVLESINFSSTFYASTHILNTDSAKPTFKYFHSMMTHLPYGMYFDGKNCKFFSDKSAWDDYPHKVKMGSFGKEMANLYYQHFDTEACALSYLAHYIKKLKESGIYDNTQIFVISDHSGFDSIGIPINSRPDALFLFKDFGAHGVLKIDKRLMANYDISSIFCENLPNGCLNVPKNILKHYPHNRSIIHTMPKFWQLEKHKSNEWILDGAYQVSDDIFVEKNWVKLEVGEKFLQNLAKK